MLNTRKRFHLRTIRKFFRDVDGMETLEVAAIVTGALVLIVILVNIFTNSKNDFQTNGNSIYAVENVGAD